MRTRTGVAEVKTSKGVPGKQTRMAGVRTSAMLPVTGLSLIGALVLSLVLILIGTAAMAAGLQPEDERSGEVGLI